MTAITGTHDGYSYSADWSRDDDGRITWDAVVHTHAGNWCGHPSGMVLVSEPSDACSEARVRIAVETAIERGVERMGRRSS